MSDATQGVKTEGGGGGGGAGHHAKPARAYSDAGSAGRSVSSATTAPEWLSLAISQEPDGGEEKEGSASEAAPSRTLKKLSPALDRAVADAVDADPRSLGENLVCLAAEVRRLMELNTRDIERLQGAYVSYETLRQRLLPLEEGAKEQLGLSEANQLLQSAVASYTLPEEQRRLCGNLLYVVMEHCNIQSALQRHLDSETWNRLISTSGLLAEPSSNSLLESLVGEVDMALGDAVSFRADLVNRCFATHFMGRLATEMGIPASAVEGVEKMLDAEAHASGHEAPTTYLVPVHSSIAGEEISRLVTNQLHVRVALRKAMGPVLDKLALDVKDGVSFDPHIEAHLHLDPHKDALSLETLSWYNKYGVAQAVVNAQSAALQRCIDLAAHVLQQVLGSDPESLPPAYLIAAKYACTLAKQAAQATGTEAEDGTSSGDAEDGSGGQAGTTSDDVMRQCALMLVRSFAMTPMREVLAHRRGPLAPLAPLVSAVSGNADAGPSKVSPDFILRGGMLDGLDSALQLVTVAILGIEPRPGFLGLTEDEQLTSVGTFVQDWSAKVVPGFTALADAAERAMTLTRSRRGLSAHMERCRAFASILVPSRMLLRCGDIQEIAHVVEKHFRSPEDARTLTVFSPFMARAARAAFVAVCGSTSSMLSPAGIHEALKLLGHRLGEDELAMMLGGVASQPSGHVNFSTFVEIASHVLTRDSLTSHKALEAVESLFTAWEHAPLDAAVYNCGAEPSALVEVFPTVMATGEHTGPTFANLAHDAFGDDCGVQLVVNELRFVLRSAPAATFERALLGAMEMRGIAPQDLDSLEAVASTAEGSADVDSRSIQKWGVSHAEARQQAADVLAQGGARTEELWQRMRAQLFSGDKAALMAGRDGETAEEKRDREALLARVEALSNASPSGRSRARRLSLAELASSADTEGGVARFMKAGLMAGDQQSWLEAPVNQVDELPEAAGGAPPELTESFRGIVRRFAISAFLRVFIEPMGEQPLERRKITVKATGLPAGDASHTAYSPFVRLQVLNDEASAVVYQAETEAVAGSASPQWEKVFILPSINRPSQHSMVFTVTTETSYGGRKVLGSARRPLSVIDVGTGTCDVVFGTSSNTQATLSLSVFDCGASPSGLEEEETGADILQYALPDAVSLVAEGAAARGEKELAFRANRLRIALNHLAAMQKRRLDPGVVHRVMRKVQDDEASTVALLHFLEARARAHTAAKADAPDGAVKGPGTRADGDAAASAAFKGDNLVAASLSKRSKLGLLDLVEMLCAKPSSEAGPPRMMKDLLEMVPECAERNLKEATRWADSYKHQCAIRRVVQSTLQYVENNAASFERVMRDLNEQDESALPEGIRLHKLFFAARSRFFSVTVPKLLRSGVLLESSPIAKNKSRSELRVRLGIDEEAMIQISISRKSMVLAVMKSAIEEVVQVHQVGTEHSPRGKLIVEELEFDTEKLIDALMTNGIDGDE